MLVYLYSSVFKTTALAAIDPTNTWSSTLGLPTTIASSVATTIDGRLYFFGGANLRDFSQILIPTIDSNGTISSWSNANIGLPQTRYWGSLVQKDNRAYVFGGASLNAPDIYADTVYSSITQPDGTLGAWQALTPLPQKLGLGAAAIVGNRIYFAGGFNSMGGYVNISKKVYSALISLDGSLGVWTEVGEMPDKIYGFSMIEHNGNLIVIGGWNGNSYLDNVYKTTPNVNGFISGWDATTSFPEPIYRASMIKVGNSILSVGGNNGYVTIDNVYFGDINQDGSINSWILSDNHLPSPVHGASLSLVNEYLYLMGGYNSRNNSFLNSVYVTKLNLNSDISLSVPLLKQTDPEWGTFIYDSANIWSPKVPRISDWGCALTSAVMVFNYHGITKLPDGTSLNPGTLNDWMKAQGDGYVNGGMVNWLALSRLSGLAKQQNPAFSFDALEYKKIGGYNPLKLTQDLKENIPVILEEPGHFIVGKGTVGTTDFAINDPYYSKLLLSDYSNTFLSLGEFIPSYTDLSYMMLIVDDGVMLSVKDANGSIIGEGFTQQPLDQDGGSAKSGSTKYFYLVPKPTDGTYTLFLTSPVTKKYNLQSFLYDKDGNVKKIDIAGISGNNIPDVFTIHFDNSNQNASLFNQNVSFQSLLADLDLLYSQKLIRFGMYTAMKAEVRAAQKLNLKSKVSAKAVLLAVSKELDRGRGKSVTEDAYHILKPAVVALRGSL